MARRVLILAVWVVACDAPVIEVEPPLFVFNSYPANGATLAPGSLGELSYTFSEDLGGSESVVANVAPLLSLDNEEEPIPLVREDRGNLSYDPETYTLTVTLEPDVRSELTAGRYVATIRSELRAASGHLLPQDFVVRFELRE